MYEVLVNRLGGLSLPRKSVVRLTDRPDMTLDVYRGRKTTIQQINRKGSVRFLGDLKNFVLYIVFLPFIYLRFINPKWSQATILLKKTPLFCQLCFYYLYESKSQTERCRLVKLVINSRDFF